MSGFETKVFSGQQPTEQDWNDYLLRVHRRQQGLTADWFATPTTPDGRSSYMVLADVVARLQPSAETPLRLLDLACGDGYLIERCAERLGGHARITGVDMSDGELAAARQRLRGQDVALVRGKAQHLPLADRALDVVLSHMAFMLMAPTAPVVDELARVLGPGGLFAAVIQAPDNEGGLFQAGRMVFRAFADEEFPGVQLGRLPVDPRVQSREGLEDLFGSAPSVWDGLDIKDFAVEMVRSVDDMWEFARGSYINIALDAARQDKLGSRMRTLYAEHADAQGLVHLYFPMRRITVRRAQ